MIHLVQLTLWLQATVRLGDLRVNAADGQHYAWIPPGSFTMGCLPMDNDCDDAEKPAHEVAITQGFWIGQTATTVGAYKQYSRKTSRPMPPSKDNEGRRLNEDDRLPIVAMTWDEAKAFCAWAGMRLPTEAEWEYAARAGSTESRYADLNAIAWYADNSGTRHLDSAALSRGEQQNYSQRLLENGNGPHPVAQKQPNSWKLYDMLGNVWQWTADYYADGYYGQSPGSDPPGPSSGEWRVLRGGSWFNTAWDVRPVLRYARSPSNRNNDFGFRCAGN